MWGREGREKCHFEDTELETLEGYCVDVGDWDMGEVYCVNPPGRQLRSRGLRGGAPTSTFSSWLEKRRQKLRTYQRGHVREQGLPMSGSGQSHQGCQEEPHDKG